jgi:putative pyruvate formate lyase activating enzyme
MPFDSLIEKICLHLNKTENILGFVTPSHAVPQMKAIIRELNKRGSKPTIVYNTGGYDSVDTIKSLEGIVDVYLPDYKYSDSKTAELFSNAADYHIRAEAALEEMFRQKGSALDYDDKGLAKNGIIIRHLVIPSFIQNSLGCLKFIAYHLSSKIHISLMSQYYPPQELNLPDDIKRSLYEQEYNEVVEEFYLLGFQNGWIQELKSSENYRPNFEKPNPFE